MSRCRRRFRAGVRPLRPLPMPDSNGGEFEPVDLPATETETEPAEVTIALSQPVFRGFRTTSGTRQAEANVEAGEQDLLGVEQQVLFDGAVAYMDVWRDRQIVTFRTRSVEFLAAEDRAARARFDVGEVTRTDVSQAFASLSQSRANLAVAQANLAASTAAYVRVIGNEPGSLSLPKPRRHIPKSLRLAEVIAAETNPQVLAAFFDELASRYNIEVVRSDLLPQVSFEAAYTYLHEPADLIDSTEIGSGARRSRCAVVRKRLHILARARGQTGGEPAQPRNHFCSPLGARAGYYGLDRSRICGSRHSGDCRSGGGQQVGT